MQRKLQHPVYKLDNLPEIIFDYFIYTNEFSGKKIKAYIGSIIRRASSTSFGITNHYCFFYGIDKNNVAWVIQNDKYGVECISFIDYLEHHTSFEIDPCTDNSNKNEIIIRACERKNKLFHLKENNCEHFVNYSVYNKLVSYQSDFTKIAQNLILWGLQCHVTMSGNEKLIKKFNKFKHNIAKPAIIKITKNTQ